MIYERIKDLCDAKGITIRELEKKAGLGNAVIAGWRQGTPRADKLLSVSKVLGVSMEDLLEEPEDIDAAADRAVDDYEAMHGADGYLAQQRGVSAW